MRSPIGTNGRLGVIVDAFNLLNDSQVLGRQDRDNGEFDEVLYHNFGGNFRFGVRYEF